MLLRKLDTHATSYQKIVLSNALYYGSPLLRKLKTLAICCQKKFVTSNFSGHKAKCRSENYTADYRHVARQRRRNKRERTVVADLLTSDHVGNPKDTNVTVVEQQRNGVFFVVRAVII